MTMALKTRIPRFCCCILPAAALFVRRAAQYRLPKERRDGSTPAIAVEKVAEQIGRSDRTGNAACARMVVSFVDGDGVALGGSGPVGRAGHGKAYEVHKNTTAVRLGGRSCAEPFPRTHDTIPL